MYSHTVHYEAYYTVGWVGENEDTMFWTIIKRILGFFLIIFVGSLGCIVCGALLCGALSLAIYGIPLIVLGLIISAIFMRYDYKRGKLYQCSACQHIFTPRFSQYLWAMHCGSTRRLRCPHCGQRVWCRQVNTWWNGYNNQDNHTPRSPYDNGNVYDL